MAVFLFIPARKENLGGTAIDGQIRLQKGRQSQLLLTLQKAVSRQSLGPTNSQSYRLCKLGLGLRHYPL